MTQPPPNAEGNATLQRDFASSLRLLFRNWTMIVPGLIAGVLAGLVSDALAIWRDADFGAAFSGLPASVATALTGVAVAIVATVVSIAYTTGMASAAWQTGRATFADGSRAFRRDFGHIVVAMLGLAAVGVVAAVLASYTFYLSLLAYAFFSIYTMPAAVVGERRGLAAIAESARMAYHKPVVTLVMVLAIAVIAALGGLIGDVLSTSVEFLGPVLSAVILQIVVAYVTLVVVGEYLALLGPAGLPFGEPAIAPPNAP